MLNLFIIALVVSSTTCSPFRSVQCNTISLLSFL